MSERVNLGRQAEGKRPFYSASFLGISVLLLSVYYYREDQNLPAPRLNPVFHPPVTHRLLKGSRGSFTY